MLVQQAFEAVAQQHPDRIALVCGERRITYAQLDQSANRCAHGLRDMGVRRGDRVTIMLENDVEAVTSIFGALKVGGVFSVVHPGTKRTKLERLLQNAAPTVLISDAAHLAQARDVVLGASSLRCVVSIGYPTLDLDEGTAIRHVRWHDFDRYPTHRPANRAIDVDLAAIVYTSGTTDKPKGVMLSHANMRAAIDMTNAYLANSSEDVVLSVLPLAHSYGLYQPLDIFQVGGRLVLERNFAFPARVIDLLRREHVTAFPGTPTIFALLLNYRGLLETPFTHLRYFTNASSALPPARIQDLRALFPDVELISMYGQTECKRISYLPADEIDRRPASVGVAVPNSEVSIVDDQGHTLGPGETGELVVRGAHVARGYWQAPELTAKKFRPGPVPGETVLHTGDLFRMDDAGYLYFVARQDDIIKSRGEKIAPLEIERFVCALDGISEVAVVGVPDSVLGEAIVLVATLQPGSRLNARAIRAYCARTLDDYMQPDHVHVVADLPRFENGKVDKHQIVAEFQSVLTARVERRWSEQCNCTC